MLSATLIGKLVTSLDIPAEVRQSNTQRIYSEVEAEMAVQAVREGSYRDQPRFSSEFGYEEVLINLMDALSKKYLWAVVFPVTSAVDAGEAFAFSGVVAYAEEGVGVLYPPQEKVREKLGEWADMALPLGLESHEVSKDLVNPIILLS